MARLIKLFETSNIYKFLLLIAFTTSIFVKIWFVSGDNVIFWYDQARDAIVSLKLWQGDLKIQGPTASGTGDLVFHGVLYYYLTAPAYGLSGGDPVWASIWLGFITSLGIFGYFFLAEQLLASKLKALLVCFFLAFSAHSVVLGTILGNPTIALATLPWFYLSIWHIYFKKSSNNKWLIAMGLSYGWLVQAAIWLFPIILLIPIGWHLNQDKKYQVKLGFSFRRLAFFLIPLLLMTNSMIVAQLQLITNGVFSLDKIIEGNSAHNHSNLTLFVILLKNYGQKMIDVLLPGQAILALSSWILLLSKLKQLNRNQQRFYLLILTVPTLLSLVFPRENYHFFFTLDAVLLLLAFNLFLYLKKSFFYPSVLALVAGFLFILINFVELGYFKQKHLSIFDRFETTLSDQLKLIDTTYQIAEGNIFSFDSYADPYWYNTAWSYLYNWYGVSHYGYSPSFTGRSQIGTVNQNILKEQNELERVHFAIAQPNNLMAENYRQDFYSLQQRKAGTEAYKNTYFGKILLSVYKPLSKESNNNE